MIVVVDSSGLSLVSRGVLSAPKTWKMVVTAWDSVARAMSGVEPDVL